MKYSGFLQKHVNVESDPYDLELTNEDEIENGNDSIFIKLLKQQKNW